MAITERDFVTGQVINKLNNLSGNGGAGFTLAEYDPKLESNKERKEIGNQIFVHDNFNAETGVLSFAASAEDSNQSIVMDCSLTLTGENQIKELNVVKGSTMATGLLFYNHADNLNEILNTLYSYDSTNNYWIVGGNYQLHLLSGDGLRHIQLTRFTNYIRFEDSYFSDGLVHDSFSLKQISFLDMIFAETGTTSIEELHALFLGMGLAEEFWQEAYVPLLEANEISFSHNFNAERKLAVIESSNNYDRVAIVAVCSIDEERNKLHFDVDGYLVVDTEADQILQKLPPITDGSYLRIISDCTINGELLKAHDFIQVYGDNKIITHKQGA